MSISPISFTGYTLPPPSLEDPEEIEMYNRLIWICCESDDIEYINTCLNTKKETVLKYPEFLHYALQNGKTKIAKLLLDAGMGRDNIETEGKDYLVSALIFSTKNEDKINNQKEIIQLLIEYGANIEGIVSGKHNTLEINPEDTTVLIETVLSGDLKLLHYFLIEKHADIEGKDANGRTPLMAAIQSRDSECIEFLIKYGANINAVNLQGKTPLTFAIHDQAEILVKKLISLGAHINKKNPNGWTPLHDASYGYLRICTQKTDNEWKQIPIEINAQILLEEGADPMALNNDEATPLHTAAVFGNIEIGQVMLTSAEAKAQKTPNFSKKRKFSHITLFPKVKGTIVRENLLNSQDFEGNTCLHKAIQTYDQKQLLSPTEVNDVILKKRKFAKWLIDQPETDVEIKNKEGKTPLEIAKENKYYEIVVQINKKRKVE